MRRSREKLQNAEVEAARYRHPCLLAIGNKWEDQADAAGLQQPTAPGRSGLCMPRGGRTCGCGFYSGETVMN